MAEVSYDPQKVQAILQDYAETLEVLTINSKPLINDLTMAADRYKPLASQIVSVIESRLFEVPVNQKLPLLYLLDSVMKNLKGRYVEVINTKVVAIFCHCFEKLTDPKTRISLYRLRQTWNPFVVKKKLAAIDKHVHALDPNWPVTATVTAPTSPTIHVNPDFLSASDKGGKIFSSTPSTTSSSQATPTSSGSGLQSSSGIKTVLSKKAPPTVAVAATSAAPAAVSVEQKRKNVLEAMKRKKEKLLAKGSASVAVTVAPEQTSSGSTTDDSRDLPSIRNSSLADPRMASLTATGGVTTQPPTAQLVKEGKRGKKKSPRRPLSSRSSLSPDYDTKSDDSRRAAKVSSRPRSASPTPQSSSNSRQHKKGSAGKRKKERGGGRKEGGGLGEILKGLDITSLMGSIQKVKEQTEGSDKASSKVEDPKVDQPPPEKKQKLNNDVTVSSAHSEVGGAKEKVGGDNTAEDEDAIPAIKSSHLNLDDIPMELLPTHQEKIMKQVERQLKSGRLSEEQHSTLVKQLDQLYALQRKKENGREGQGRGGPNSPPDQRKSPSPPQTGHSSSDTHSSSNHLPHSPPHHPSSSVPPPSLSDSDFHAPHSPPPPPPPHRAPHTHPRDRYPPPRPFPHNYPSRGPRSRPFRGGRGPPGRGRRPYDRHPHPLPPSEQGAVIDWYGQGPPPERNRGPGGGEGDPKNSNYPQNQGGNSTGGGSSDPTELFSKLVEMGIIKNEPGEREGEGGVAPLGTGPTPPSLTPPPQEPLSGSEHSGQPPPLPPPPPAPFAIPKLSFTVATLKKPYSSLVHLMYIGDPCATCGLRFRDRAAQNYSAHLDWHYKINSRDKALQRPRHWFLHPEDWIKFEESMENEENREPLVLEKEVEGREEGGEGEGGVDEGQESSCQVIPGEEAEVCTICAEQFDQFWEEELEEWHFREAVRHEGKLYHTYCYEDAKESGMLDKSLQQQPSPMETDQKPLAVA